MQNKLPASAFRQGDAEIMRWVVYPEADTPIETILRPEYWTHVARDLRQWNEIQVRAADGSYRLDLVVLACGPLWAKVHVIGKHEFGSAAAAVAAPSIQDAEFEVIWRGAAKWSVKRKSDGEIMADGLDKDGANAWIAKYRRSVPAAA